MQDEDVLKHLTDVRLIFTGNKDNGSEDSEMVLSKTSEYFPFKTQNEHNFFVCVPVTNILGYLQWKMNFT